MFIADLFIFCYLPSSKTILNLIRNNLIDRYGSTSNSTQKLRDIFEDLDTNNDSKINLNEFKEGIQKLRVDLSKSEISELFEHFDKSDLGKIKYMDFIDYLFEEDNLESKVTSKRIDVKHILKDIQDALEEELGPGAHQGRAMKRIFSDIDLDDDGRVDLREFMQAMKLLKVPIGQKEVEIIFDKYDRNGNGSMDYGEFLELFDFKPSDNDKYSRSDRK